MLCMLHGHVGLSRPFYVNKIYSFIHEVHWVKSLELIVVYRLNTSTVQCIFMRVHGIVETRKAEQEILFILAQPRP